jgi:hypothetical protein
VLLPVVVTEPEMEPTHGDILRALGQLEATCTQILARLGTDSAERLELGKRVGALENRMAQVVILAVVASALSPFLWHEFVKPVVQPPAQHQHP